LRSIVDIFKALSNEQSVFIFKAIWYGNQNGIDMSSINEIYACDLRNKYYSSLSALIEADLIKTNKEGRYCFTSLGKLLYEQMKFIENALQDKENLLYPDFYGIDDDNSNLKRPRIWKYQDTGRVRKVREYLS
jgi:predicted transcriptional regulator